MQVPLYDKYSGDVHQFLISHNILKLRISFLVYF